VTELTGKPEIETDAVLLTEELTGFYSTPTPKGWLDAKRFVFD